MGAFLENAQKILDVARQADAGGLKPSDLAFVVEASGQIRILADPGWSLAGLSAHYGASMSYRLRLDSNHLRVDGKSSGTVCQLSAERSGEFTRRWLSDRPTYLLTA